MNNRIRYILLHSLFHNLNMIYNKIAHKFRLEFASLEPRTAEIEITNGCNMRCIHCTRTNHYLAKKKPLDIGILSFSNFVKIVNQFKYLDQITLQGLGEPFLNPGIFSIIKYAKRKNISVEIATNVSLLKEEVCKKLIESGVDTEDNIVLSIDSFNADSFEKIRPPIKFTDIINNLNIFNNMCAEKTNISLHLVVTNENIDYLEDYIRMADSYGIKQVSFTDQNFDMAGDNIDKLQIKEPAKLRATINKVIKLSKEKNIRFSYYKLDSSTWPPDEVKHPCWFPWRYPYITWDGFVTPCCARPYPKEFNFGNVFETNFRKIWNSKKYREFRKALKTKKIPDICIGCPHSIL